MFVQRMWCLAASATLKVITLVPVPTGREAWVRDYQSSVSYPGGMSLPKLSLIPRRHRYEATKAESRTQEARVQDYTKAQSRTQEVQVYETTKAQSRTQEAQVRGYQSSVSLIPTMYRYTRLPKLSLTPRRHGYKTTKAQSLTQEAWVQDYQSSVSYPGGMGTRLPKLSLVPRRHGYKTTEAQSRTQEAWVQDYQSSVSYPGGTGMRQQNVPAIVHSTPICVQPLYNHCSYVATLTYLTKSLYTV